MVFGTDVHFLKKCIVNAGDHKSNSIKNCGSDKYAGELYISESGHLEFAYSASAGPALQKAFHAEPGEAFGFMAGSPAAIGLVMADTAMKASSVKITSYMTPDMGTAHSNEVILSLSGDASAVKEAVLNARIHLNISRHISA